MTMRGCEQGALATRWEWARVSPRIGERVSGGQPLVSTIWGHRDGSNYTYCGARPLRLRVGSAALLRLLGEDDQS